MVTTDGPPVNPRAWLFLVALASGSAPASADSELVRLREDGMRQLNKRNCAAAVRAWTEAVEKGDGVSAVLLCDSFNVSERGCQMPREENRQWCERAKAPAADAAVKNELREIHAKVNRGEL
jgi:hypothetical protein